MAAYSNVPDGMEPGLENTAYYDPPNLTWPFAMLCIVDRRGGPADRRLGRSAGSSPSMTAECESIR